MEIRTTPEYLAGLFDGEGSISIAKKAIKLKDGSLAPWYVLMVCLGNTYRPIVDHLSKEYGSPTRTVKRIARNQPGRPIFQWSVASDKAELFLRVIYPHLVIKKDEADLAFEFRNHVRKHRHAHMGYNGGKRGEWFETALYKQIQAERIAMYWKMRNLKKYEFPDAIDMTTNSGKLQNGQSRANPQETAEVCNEQVSSPKGKVCSDLNGNIESPAEMPGPRKLYAV